MERKWLKLGLVLSLLWLLALVGIGSSYRTVESSRLQVEELGYGIDSLRSSLIYDAPYRTKMIERQALDLQLIYALRLQIDAFYQKSWLMPDLNQLLFSTDRFIEQAQAYLDNELAVQKLANTIRQTRTQDTNSEALSNKYFQLSANVFEAMYLSEKANAEIFRHVDKIYQESTTLEPPQRQQLQKVLVDVSQVLSSYAQGSYLVDKLISHDVSNHISALEIDYRTLLRHHLIAAVGVTLLTMTGFLVLLFLAQSNPSSISNIEIEESDPPVAKPVVSGTSSPKVVEAEPQINFDVMLSSLNGDVESVCMLLEVFVADHADDVNEITRLLTDSPEDAQRKAHSLKGVGGNLGAHKLREAAAKVEAAIQQDISQLSGLLDELNECLTIAIQEAKAFLKENHS